MGSVPDDVRKRVRERAAFRCEYCLIPENEHMAALLGFHIEHITPKVHLRIHGMPLHDESRLALACPRCNGLKGKATTAPDPDDGVQPLFDPRTTWTVHFVALPSGVIEPLTSVGRATATLLRFNADADALRVRAEWWLERKWPG